MSDGTIFPTAWSVDGSHLYVGVMPQVFSEYLYNHTAALFSLSLATGEVDELLDASPVHETFYDFALSKDDARIAYVRLGDQPLELAFKELATGKVQSIELEPRFDAAGGGMTWSQDGRSLIFVATDFPEDNSNVQNTLFRWDTQTRELVKVFDLPEMLFVITDWDEENGLVTLRNYHEEVFFMLDLSTGEMQPISR
jgi:protease II